MSGSFAAFQVEMFECAPYLNNGAHLGDAIKRKAVCGEC